MYRNPFFRKGTAIADPHDGEANYKDNERSEANLQQRQIFRLTVETEEQEKKIMNIVHNKNVSQLRVASGAITNAV